MKATMPMDVYNRIVPCKQMKARAEYRSTSGLKQTNEIQIQLEVGHKAAVRQRPTAEGFTHDWIVYVRGPEGSNIQHFVEKVEFHLHETFPKARRVVRDPPYQVTESGYGGFVLPVDIYLRNNAEPKKIRFIYELFLGVTNTVSHSRCEKISFRNPSPEFYARLLRGGAIEDDNSPPSSPTPSSDGDTSVLSLTPQIERQQRTNRPTEKTSHAVRPGKRIPVAGEDCKVRINARGIFGYGKSSADDERKQCKAGAEFRSDFESDIISHTKTNYGTPTRPKPDASYYGMRDGPLKSDGCGTPKMSCKFFEGGTPKEQKKAVDPEVQFIGQKKALKNGTSVKVSSDCKNVEDDDDVCIVGWTWNTQAKRNQNADHLRVEAEQRLAVTRKDGERHHQNTVKETHDADKTSKGSLQKPTSFAAQSSANPKTLQPIKLSSYNTVTSITNNPAPARQTNPIMSSPKPAPTASTAPFNFVNSNSLTTKSLSNNVANTNVFAPKSNIPNPVTTCYVGAKSSLAPSQGKIAPRGAVSHHHHSVANSVASTAHPCSVNLQSSNSGDSAFVAAIIPEEPEVAVTDLVELPVSEKQRRGRTKKPVLVQPNFEVIKRKRGRPRKEPITINEPERKRPAIEDFNGKATVPLSKAVSCPVPVETVSIREKSILLIDAPRTCLLNTSKTTLSNDTVKSVARIADQLRCGSGQTEMEKSFEADDEPVLKEESNQSLSDSEVDFEAFSSGINFRSSLMSTPIKECSAETAEDTKPPQKKSKLRIRFKPFVEQFSYDEDEDIVLSADALASTKRSKQVRIVDQLLAQKEREVDRKESVEQSVAEQVAKSLHHPKERSAVRDTASISSDIRSTRETSAQSGRTESVAAAAGSAGCSARPEAHGVKMSLKPLKDSSDVVSGSTTASTAARQSTRPTPHTKSVPIANARHPTSTQSLETIGNISSCTAVKTVETIETTKSAGHQPETVSASTGTRRNCADEVSNSLLPPGLTPSLATTDAIPHIPNSQTRSNEDRTKPSKEQTTKSVENSQHRKPEERLTSQAQRVPQPHPRQTTAASACQNSGGVEVSRTQQCRTIARPVTRPNVPHANVGQNSAAGPRETAGPPPVAKVTREESRHRPRAQKELSFGRKRKMEDLNVDEDKENQPKRTKTLLHDSAPTENKAPLVADSDKMAPQKNAQAPVVPNGEHVAALLDLQRKLMSISDMSVLRLVVQIIEETGKYRLNEATFDFDLCNLDPLTVKKLQHCLSTIAL